MRAIFGVLLCGAALSGCAHFMNDQYTPIPGGAGSAADVNAAAHSCRDDASNTYLWGQGHAVALLGIVAGGAAGGAVGGGLAGGSMAAFNTDVKPPTLDQMIELCMLKKGYTGFSEH